MFDILKQNWVDIRNAYADVNNFFFEILFIIRVINYFLLIVPLVLILGFVMGLLLFQNPFNTSVDLLQKVSG